MATTTLRTITCPTCKGRRVVTQLVPNMKGPSGNQYQSAIKPLKPVNRQCPTCCGYGALTIGDVYSADSQPVHIAAEQAS